MATRVVSPAEGAQGPGVIWKSYSITLGRRSHEVVHGGRQTLMIGMGVDSGQSTKPRFLFRAGSLQVEGAAGSTYCVFHGC